MKRAHLTLFFLFIITGIGAQYATVGTGNLKDKIWWFNWNGVTVANGVSKSFTTTDGLQVDITFSNVGGTAPVPVPRIMNTWSGAVLHLLYNFADPAIMPALYSTTPVAGQNTDFTITVTATRNGIAIPFTFVAADAEASSPFETTTLTTNGSSWNSIDFFKNSSQTINPLTGCNTNTIVIENTYGGTAATGQNPVLATQSPALGSLQINTTFTRQGVTGGMAIAFGILAPIDRGDLPASYGFVQHRLTYTAVNSCNFQPPYPSLLQNVNLSIGAIAGDADGAQTTDDNIAGADEDALTSMPLYDRTGSYTITLPVHNTTGADAYLSGWFDKNQNGSFEVGEFATIVVPDQATTAALTWTGVPVALTTGSNYAFRFRLSSDQAASQNSTGFAVDGEAEDYFSIVNAVAPPPVVTAGFNAPDTVCVNTPVTVTNTSVNGSSYFWNFCAADLAAAPVGTNLGNIGGNLSSPVFMDYVFVNNNYYGFVVNHSPSSLVRLDFGNSLLNTPTSVNLGNFGGVLPAANGAEGIQVVQQQGKWYVMMVGGGAAVNNASRILKLDFGASITNPSPVATNWGNIGNMERPVDLHIFQEGNDWYGFTVNAGTNTITRFNFGADFNNTPTAVNLGNIGGLNFPTGIYAIKDNTNWRIFVVNGATATGTSLTRLDFGASLLNVPTGVNLGNPGNALHQPRDFTIMKSCGQVVGFAVNGQAGFYDLVKLDFNNDLSSVPTATSLGSTGSLNFPHSISKLFRVNENLYSFITNVANNTITRLEFQGCTNASIPNSALKDPPAVIYKVPGTYSINLTVDDGLATQTAFCRQVVVKPIPTPDFSFEQDVCNPLSVQFKNETTGNFTSKWNFGNGTGSLLPAPVVVYNAYQSYVVKLVAGGGMCADSIEKIILVNLERDSLVTRHDTTSCDGKGVELQALPGLVYCWSPAATLSDAAAPNPIATPVVKTTYYVRSQVTGKNLITNGDFSQGNMAFSSDYSYLPSNGFPSGVYTVYSDPRVWHAGFSACSDHTGAGGNMMLVNGSSDPGKKVWSQTVTVAPNSNYAFSTWIQTLTSSNPGSLQFSINGIQLGNVFTASAQTCKWNQFYTAWNSGNNTSVTISIVNVNLALGGNDFALDDIFFGTIGMKYDSVTVGLIRSPVLTTTPDTLLCLGDTIRLVAAGALHYNWSPAQAISNTAVPGPFVYPVATTAYTVKAYNTPGCEAAQAIAVRVSPAPAFAITPAVTSVCEGEAVRITASGADHYTWMADSQLMNNQPGNQIGISPAKTMTYSVKVTDDLCNRTDTLYSLVKVIAKPVTHVSKTSDIDCMTGGARLNAIGGTTYHWSPATGLSDTEIASPVVLAMQTTKYYVTVSKEGCSAVDSVTVVVNLNTPGNLYLVPTAFTPNGDGKNDCFGLKHWGQLKDLNFAIYNRWGQQIFLTRDVSNCWDGTFKGERQPPGAFIYVISGVTLCGPVLRRGTVLLIR